MGVICSDSPNNHLACPSNIFLGWQNKKNDKMTEMAMNFAFFISQFFLKNRL